MLSGLFLTTAILLMPASAQDWLWGDAYIKNSLRYAKQQTSRHRNAISRNVKNLPGSVPTIDLLWPGNGFDQAAYAGNYAVLKILEKHGVLKVGRIMGASGGATAALLALASDKKGAEAARLMTKSFGAQADTWGTEGELRTEYLSRINSGWGTLTGTIQKDLYVALKDGNGNWATLYNLQNPKQAAEAVLGSGGLDPLKGVKIPGLNCLGETTDGGIMSAFKGKKNPTLYYAAWYGNSFACDRSCIEKNFKAAVDMTIKLLKSPNFVVPLGFGEICGPPFIGTCTGMVLSKTGAGSDLERLATKHLGGGSPMRYEPSKAAPNVWVDASNHCGGWFRRAEGPTFTSSLLDLVENEEQDNN